MSRVSVNVVPMQIILIPGFWLDGASWEPITSDLAAAGHDVQAITLPGMTAGADRSAVTLRDQVEAVIQLVDAATEPVVLVGHSGGGAIAHAVVDARPLAVAHVVYVDSGPLGHGDCINDGLPVVDGEIPLPDWSVFDEESLVDMTDAVRARFAAIAIPEPAHVAADAQMLGDERRYDVPVTVISCEMREEQIRELITAGHPYVAELSRIAHYDIVDLPTGHWPQFTKPAEVTRIILGVLG